MYDLTPDETRLICYALRGDWLKHEISIDGSRASVLAKFAEEEMKRGGYYYEGLRVDPAAVRAKLEALDDAQAQVLIEGVRQLWRESFSILSNAALRKAGLL